MRFSVVSIFTIVAALAEAQQCTPGRYQCR
ncbi:uncharacterized protein CCOS01_15001 [Colletotrichum costaricense]|nr:uncharacterized protein CCOS01_15001 [Colletotrichum costaricense]KAK1511239.1 hypothetical protein CCOS01_15001 [Colletotrichum costaricense]